MHTAFPSFKLSISAALLAATVILYTGCSGPKKHLLLREYGPSVAGQAEQFLKGTTVCIKGFRSELQLARPDKQTEPQQVPGFTFVAFTEEQSSRWKQERKALDKTTPKEQLVQVGNLRGGLGQANPIHALNDPGAWLAESLGMDLASLGASLVEPSRSETADLRLSGTVRCCWVDCGFAAGGHLIVDLELEAKNAPVSRKTFYTAGGSGTAFASNADLYKVLRESRQKLSCLIAQELRQAVKH